MSLFDDITNQVSNSAVNSNTKLANSVKKKSNLVAGLGGDPNKVNSPGAVERIFDVLSRPNYASAGAVDALLSGENPLSGAWEGLTGRDKTTYGNVIDEHTDIDNKFVKGALGFAGDVLLDPTTYVGGGVIKGAGKAAQSKAGIKAVKQAKKVGDDGFDSITKMARDKYLQEVKDADSYEDVSSFLDDYIQKGDYQKKASPESRINPDEVANKFNSYKIAAYRDIYDEAYKAANPEWSKLRFTVGLGSHKKSYDLSSTVLSEAAAKVAERNGVQRIRKAFKTPTIDGGQISDFRAINEGTWRNTTNEVIEQSREIRDKLGLDEAQNADLFMVLEKGTSTTDEKVMEAATYLRGEFKAIYDARTKMRQRGIGPEITGYLPRILRNPNQAVAAKNANGKYKTIARSDGTVEFMHDISTLKAIGANPVTDPWELLTRERMDLASTQVQRYFEDDIVNNYGFIVNEGDSIQKMLPSQHQEFTDMGLVRHTLNDADQTVAYLPTEISHALKEITDVWHNANKSSELQTMFDGVLNSWKGLVTVVNPSHHVRNLYGDFFLSYLGGVTNPKHWKKSAHILETLGTNPKAKTVIAGQSLSSQQVLTRFKELGLKQGFFDVDAIEVLEGQVKSKFGGQVVQDLMKSGVNKGRKIGESRETFTRLGHFIGATETEMKKLIKAGVSPEKAFHQATEMAGKNTRKWMIDYGDLTASEQKFKKFVPFYTYMRKSFPLVVEAMMLNPKKIVMPTKMERAVNDMLGNKPDNLDSLGRTVPDWVMDNGMPIFVTGGDEPVVLTPDLPIQSTFERFSGLAKADGVGGAMEELFKLPLEEFANAANPMLKAPFEVATGTSTFTGAPIPDPIKYMTGQIPLTKRLKDIGEDTKEAITGEGDYGDVGAELVKFLTGSAQDLGADRQQGELNRQQRALSEMLEALKTKRRNVE